MGKRISQAYHIKETGFSAVRGNFKLGGDTLAINPGPSLLCPSEAAGLCKITQFCPEAFCFSQRDENRYPRVLAFRMQQLKYWQEHVKHPQEMAKDFDYILSGMRVKVNWMRLCVASELYSHYDWAAADVLGYHLRKKWSIGTYGYSSVPWHSYHRLNFVVRGSGHGNSPMGDTIVIENGVELPRGYVECPTTCGVCLWCKVDTYRRIAFRVHAKRKRR